MICLSSAGGKVAVCCARRSKVLNRKRARVAKFLATGRRFPDGARDDFMVALLGLTLTVARDATRTHVIRIDSRVDTATYEEHSLSALREWAFENSRSLIKC